MLCPCGSNKLYNECCGIFIEGQAFPKTPEALMRSRFTAFSKNRIDYIEKTMQGKAAIGFNASETQRNNKAITWLKLQVIQAPYPLSNTAYVEFSASYLENGKHYTLHEKSEFIFKNGQWYYVAAV